MNSLRKSKYISLPLRSKDFWIIQVLLLAVAGGHLIADEAGLLRVSPFPASETVGFLLIPVGYGAVKFGKKGAVLTAIWGIILWMPDLLLPNDEGQPWADIVELCLILIIAFAVGQKIDQEQAARSRAEAAEILHASLESKYKALFDANRAPTLLADLDHYLITVNGEAEELFGSGIVGKNLRDIGINLNDLKNNSRFEIAENGELSIYQVAVTRVPENDYDHTAIQIVLYDITEEANIGKAAHLYAKELLKVQEDERRRISQEIHDVPVQHLVRLAQVLRKAEAEADNNENLTKYLESAETNAIEIIEELRALAKDLRPPVLDDFGLIVALQGFISRLDTRVEVQVNAEGLSCRFSPEVELGLFRICQEAIRNALAHASPTKVQVSLKYKERDSEIYLAIKDNGVGMTMGSETSRLGIVGMKERAEILGGALCLASTLDQGTSIEVIIRDVHNV
ncbi:MAG: hypothetical protein HKL80_12365 [Acidimicrobiales bacterium]|nr:hypothetical protein [Acidimicrobiales bacterium]